jgi:uncharacterized membrane protein YuzA (DUF378 family)
MRAPVPFGTHLLGMSAAQRVAYALAAAAALWLCIGWAL